MKRSILAIAVCALLYPLSSHAILGVSIGGKVGSASYSGDVLPGSGDVGGNVQYGLIVGFTGFPLVDFEVHANYFTKDFTYRYSVAGVPGNVDFEFRDLSVLILAKRDIFKAPTFPLSLYVGGGMGWHLLNTELAKAAAGGSFDPSQADNPITLISDIAKAAGHGLLGLRISSPPIPFAVFTEARYGHIFAADGITVMEIEAGLTIGF